MQRFLSVQATPIPPERVERLQKWLSTSEALQFQKLIVARAVLADHEAELKGLGQMERNGIADKHQFVLDLIVALRSGKETDDEPTTYDEIRVTPLEPS